VFDVRTMELCPRRFLTSSRVKPCARRNVAAEWRRSWKRMCGSSARVRACSKARRRVGEVSRDVASDIAEDLIDDALF
jgi:hypothetical protein